MDNDKKYSYNPKGIQEMLPSPGYMPQEYGIDSFEDKTMLSELKNQGGMFNPIFGNMGVNPEAKHDYQGYDVGAYRGNLGEFKNYLDKIADEQGYIRGNPATHEFTHSLTVRPTFPRSDWGDNYNYLADTFFGDNPRDEVKTEHDSMVVNMLANLPSDKRSAFVDYMEGMAKQHGKWLNEHKDALRAYDTAINRGSKGYTGGFKTGKDSLEAEEARKIANDYMVESSARNVWDSMQKPGFWTEAMRRFRNFWSLYGDNLRVGE